MQMKFSDGQAEFSRVFNVAILGYSQNSQKIDAHKKLMFYSIVLKSKLFGQEFLRLDTLPVAQPIESKHCLQSCTW